MTPSSPHQQALVEDLTTSDDPREHMPTPRANVRWRSANDLADEVFDLIGLGPEPKDSPYSIHAESILYLLSNILIACCVAIPVAITSTATLGVIVGITTLITGVVLVERARRGNRA